MFKRKPKIVYGWSVTGNTNKLDGDVMLGLGSYRKLPRNGDVQKWDFEEQVIMRLNKDQARKLCETIMKYFDE